MAYSRLPLKDPRTIARDIPGICDILFPQLTAGTVLYFNKRTRSIDNVKEIPNSYIEKSSIQHAMLFEIAYARGEQMLDGKTTPDWDDCLEVAIKRQRRHFDAVLPDKLKDADKLVAEWVGKNIANMLYGLHAGATDTELVRSPRVFGFQWLAPGEGDFSFSDTLIEVKCTSKNFSSADYRQILIYWLLSYASAIELGTTEWLTGVLMNPRLNRVVEVSFNELIQVTAAGKSKIEIIELFNSVVGDYALKELAEFKM
ncbi:hypothetical protein [Hahella sp. HN01]|uniref:hypothetical protein n=1 Tax=Hahella sp. HN01 TaxID=2847262 RepID=UPI001C1EB43B|nr:hypothetical protein [Hahella sp. HN01]MBU6955286.1 hypothetical protein [Hahella sp. HN01]